MTQAVSYSKEMIDSFGIDEFVYIRVNGKCVGKWSCHRALKQEYGCFEPNKHGKKILGDIRIGGEWWRAVNEIERTLSEKGKRK